ncbi:glycosyltransferase [Schinkia azotoformans]|uniref:glycosyltransferase n=1 Tax=Schinkia azotoformans TaxID=1454 RepID=UPI002DBB6E52|nr:glycosyltransferase [Schinkia azotoformans]MEC1744260.1 glycosyltransferase [Schinkia azotoformans]MEC1759511.1 glycosyltransferase [Schinkia azotoformans]
MANILFITQNFLLGGLETHIENVCKMLKQENHNIYLVASKSSNPEIISEYLSGYHLIDGWTPTTGENVKYVSDEIKKYIKEKNIDIAHIHPYESFLAGGIAAVDSGIPHTVTIHSPLNISPVYGSIYRIFVKSCLLPAAAKIYCVSEEAKKAIESQEIASKIDIMPNPIDANIFSEAKWDLNNHFAFISRLDEDKIQGAKEVIKFVHFFNESNKAHTKDLRIIGDGTALNELKQWIEMNYSNPDWIKIIGLSNEVQKYIATSSVVFGMGRVAIESGIMNIPTVLVGYDGIKGFICKNNVKNIADYNFSGRNVENISFETLANLIHNMESRLDDYRLRQSFIEKNSIDRIHENYLNDINELASHKPITPNWIRPVKNIINENVKDNILDFKFINNWLDKLQLNSDNSENKFLLDLAVEIQRQIEENKNLSLQLGLVNQHFNDYKVYKGEVESQLKERVNFLENALLKKNEQQFDDFKVLINKLSEELRDEINQNDGILKALSNSESNALQTELEHLRAQYNNLKLQYKQLENIRSLVSGKISEISQTKSFKVVNVMKRFRNEFLTGDKQSKKEFLNWFYRKVRKQQVANSVNKYNPLVELQQILYSEGSTTEIAASTYEVEVTNSVYEKEYNTRYKYYQTFLNRALPEESRQIIEKIKGKTFKGIIVYPMAINFEPIQRPQQILREMAKDGYLCFFFEPSSSQSFKLNEVEENLYVINKEEFLLPVIKDHYVIILCSWLMQMPWADQLPNKYLWYDVLDQLEFFSLYDEKMHEKHKQILKEADLVTYSAKKIYKYVSSRTDALYLPNGANIEDFVESIDDTVPEGTKTFGGLKPIIGYYGAIEEWFDNELLENIAKKNPDWKFVLIGNNGTDYKINASNVEYLGQIPYNQLKNYAKYFDVAIIPFKVNDLTNCVSPVKFFEYCALGLPVVSSPIEEMKQYESDNVKIAGTFEEFEQAIRNCLQTETKELARIKGKELAKENSWKSRVEAVEEQIKSSIKGLRIYSNIFADNSVSAMTATFLDFAGENFYSGGAERYLIDLAELADEIGLRFDIYQYGDFSWVRRYRNINVLSLSDGKITTKPLSIENVQGFNQNFYRRVKERSRLNIYSAFFEAWPKSASPSIGISHGVAWDNPSCQFETDNQFWQTNKRFISSAESCDEIVSVDTNTANWFQTVNYQLGKKIKVIPNYVDLNEFKPNKGNESSGGKDRIKILYPRRLYEARGLYLVLDILDDILTQFPQVEFHFVGKGFDQDIKHVVKKQKKWKDRVKWYALPPEEMHKAYQDADISLIPTLYSEGTSLSCLEAMASGSAVIATRIGGLTDLVIDNFNGFLIDPNKEALKNAIIELICNPNKLTAFKNRGIEVANSFSKVYWKEKWKKVIQDLVNSCEVNSNELNAMPLIEIKLEKKSELDDPRVKQLIHDLLINNVLTYIRVKNEKANKEYSFGRLQWINCNEESYTTPDLVLSSLSDEHNKNVIKLDKDFYKNSAKNIQSLIKKLN